MTYMPRFVFSAVFTLAIGAIACDGGDGGEGETNADGTSSADETGDGDTDMGTETETTGEPDCPVGTFDCPCGENGECVDGLECNLDNLCALDGSGSSGTPTSTTTSTSATEPEEPGAYDPEACESPSEILNVEDVDGQFCSLPCVIDDDCPEGPSGTTQACTISTIGGEPNHCVLLCEPSPDGESCPEGSTCKAVPQQPNFGLCTYP